MNDFPFYDGRPVRFSGAQWAMLMAAVALGFLVLAAPVPFYNTAFGQFLPAILFPAIPLAVLAWLAPVHWRALFRRVRLRDAGWMVCFAVLNLLVTFGVGLAVMHFHGAHSNPAFAMIAAQGPGELALFFLKTLPQLLGEEIVTILPMLALMAWLHGPCKASRRTAIVVAWLATGAMFGALHLPTYGWDFLQCLVVIGGARLVLSLAYLKTKNPWVSTGAHVLNDWAMFGIGLMGVSSQVA